MTIFVTGGAGYIGTHVCVELQQAGHEVVVFDNFCRSSPKSLDRVRAITGRTLHVVEGDVRDASAVQSAMRASGATAVVHLAGLKVASESMQQPLAYYDSNVGGAIALLQAMAACGVKRLVFSSSATVYGTPQHLPVAEDHALFAATPYGHSKLTVEEMVRAQCVADPTLSACILRYFNPAGAHPSGLIGEEPSGTPNNLFPVLAQVAAGLRAYVQVWGGDYATPDGTGIRDYVHVQDLARGHVQALQLLNQQPGCHTINLGSGTGYSVLQALRAFEHASGRPIPYRIEPRRAGDVATSYADIGLAKSLLNWWPRMDLPSMCASAWNWQSRNPTGYV